MKRQSSLWDLWHRCPAGVVGSVRGGVITLSDCLTCPSISRFLGICGAGVQLALLVLFVVLLTIAGTLFEGRGVVLTAILVVYAITSFVGGAASGSHYARSDGKVPTCLTEPALLSSSGASPQPLLRLYLCLPTFLFLLILHLSSLFLFSLCWAFLPFSSAHSSAIAAIVCVCS